MLVEASYLQLWSASADCARFNPTKGLGFRHSLLLDMHLAMGTLLTAKKERSHAFRVFKRQREQKHLPETREIHPQFFAKSAQWSADLPRVNIRPVEKLYQGCGDTQYFQKHGRRRQHRTHGILLRNTHKYNATVSHCNVTDNTDLYPTILASILAVRVLEFFWWMAFASMVK